MFYLRIVGRIVFPGSRFAYRKIPHINPGLIEARKHFLVGLYWGGGLVFAGNFELASDLCMPENSSFGVQSKRQMTTCSA